jgi:hypothetical protein
MTPRQPPLNASARRESGAALVVGLILLLVLTLLAISGMTTASLELLMAGNLQYQKRAFEAADSGIEQALAIADFDSSEVVGDYDDPLAPDAIPQRGTGEPIANCDEVDSPTDAEQCEFFMRFVVPPAVTPPAPPGCSVETCVRNNFVIDSFGAAERGGSAEHRQGFYIEGPAG